MTLSGFMDRAPSSTLFMATTNVLVKIHGSLKSRLSQVCFDHPNTARMEKFAKKIALLEGLPLTDDQIKSICVSVNGCFRELLIVLERHANNQRSQSSVQQNITPPTKPA
ncbi:hypothetical protein BEN30_11325 [Magnetovibrio blakemorei]|uniref:Uncharacterized protein n=2 Tax=Magnetovibrio blakemorei TaxID=28181 RepID=A0A1E5Q7X8_9PROT|nr:hypothetical protein BEN30_11325 [Magnetovibrio blakemorei]